MVQAQAARKVASCGGSLDASTQTTAAGSPAPFSTPSLDYSFRGVQVYPDGRLTAGHSTRLGVDVGVKAVLASMRVEVPNDDNFEDADHVLLGMMVPAAAGLCQDINTFGMPGAWILGNPCYQMSANTDSL